MTLKSSSSLSDQIFRYSDESDLTDGDETSLTIQSTCGTINENCTPLVSERLGMAQSIAVFVNGIIGAIQGGRQVCISLNKRGGSTMRVIFPSRCHPSLLCILLRILDLIHEALTSGVILTKRDIYYKDVELFKSQNIVDKVVELIAEHFNVRRSELNVVAASKGLLKGSVYIEMKDSFSSIDGESAGDEGILIPHIENINRIMLDNTDYILVFEKEAAFHAVRNADFCIPQKCLLITGKGYPDVCTREFLKLIELENAEIGNCGLKKIPIFAIVDGDPFGLDIYLVYKYGSKNMAHQQTNLAINSLQWLGVSQHDWLTMTSIFSANSLLLLTTKDRKKAMDILDKDILKNKEVENVKLDICRMLMCGRKVEMQIMDSSCAEFERYLLRKLRDVESYFASASTVDEDALSSECIFAESDFEES